jgi:hypothetical protein
MIGLKYKCENMDLISLAQEREQFFRCELLALERKENFSATWLLASLQRISSILLIMEVKLMARVDGRKNIQVMCLKIFVH